MFSEMLAMGAAGGGTPTVLLDTIVTIAAGQTYDTGIHIDTPCVVFVCENDTGYAHRETDVIDSSGNKIVLGGIDTGLFHPIRLENGNVGVTNTYSAPDSVKIHIVTW